MKNKIYIALISSALLLGSCDIDREPFDSKTQEDILGGEQGIEMSTLGNYAILKGDVGQSEGWEWISQLHRIGEYGGDNVSLSGVTTDEMYYFYNYNNIKNNGRSNFFWVKSYKAILGTNTIIESSEEGISTEQDQLIGENYYLRALVYFNLVNVYGRPYTQNPNALGVPLKLTTDVNEIPNRHSVKEVYDQVIADLKKAEALMGQDKGSIYASEYAAKALLSRVYLYMNKNEEAAQYASEVIDSGKYILLSTAELADYPKKAPEENMETIFALKYEKDDYISGYNTVGGFYSTIDNVGWGEMYASSSYLELISKHPEDVRKKFITAPYITDQEDERIPVIYWVNDAKNYETKETYTANGNTYFDEDGQQIEVLEEVDGNSIRYYFLDAGNQKIYVIKDFKAENRFGYPKFYIVKASQQEGLAQLWSPVISRLAEMYLNRAEAYAKLGMEDQALQDVNIIRERAGIPTYNNSNELPSELNVLEVVLEERRLEMAFEGWRKFDVFRNNQTLVRTYPGVHYDGGNVKEEITPDDPRVILFIPEQQIDVQPGLEQNP